MIARALDAQYFTRNPRSMSRRTPSVVSGRFERRLACSIA